MDSEFHSSMMEVFHELQTVLLTVLKTSAS
jgi:hypothetical protein